MSKIIPKEKLSAYQRWELTALDEISAEESLQAPIEAAADIPTSPEPAGEGMPEEMLSLPTAEDIERLHQQAYEEGFAAGVRDGKLAGIEEGRRQSAQEAVVLRQLLSALDHSLQHLDQEIGQDMLTLTLNIAKQVLRETLNAKPEAVLAVVREAINSLPQHARHPQLILNPDDAVLVKESLADELSHLPWRIIDDARIQRGGCRVELESGEIDATIDSRWRRLAAALGRNDNWSE
ncbi:MAG: flagellar assembly protein FliH [Burkholderiales bacterium]|nr:flagellar assembly protein FliH [Sulfuricellaceae bacterium]